MQNKKFRLSNPPLSQSRGPLPASQKRRVSMINLYLCSEIEINLDNGKKEPINKINEST